MWKNAQRIGTLTDEVPASRGDHATLMAMRRKRAAGQEAPMVITPRDLVRLVRQIFKSSRRKKT
jgi:hypothetical protein